MSDHPFWFTLVCLAIAWYTVVTVYVGWKGYPEIRLLLGALRAQRDGESPRSRSTGDES